jgi:hypothetical protein
MEFTSIPVIVLICYLIGEIYKVVFKSKEDLYKLIPVFVTLLGGLVGLGVHLVEPSFLNVNNVISALEIGLISGAASTGMHQMVKQIWKK